MHPLRTLLPALLLWVVLTGLVLSRPVADDGPSEEPARPSLWDRVSGVPVRLFGGSVERAAVARAIAQVGAADWHRAGKRGKGIKVAVLDSGLKGYRNAAGKVLPAGVKARSFRKDGQLEARESQHGVLCGEVIHHLAPDAELLLANWEPESPEAFLRAVQWARDEGARVISCSVIMPTWSDGEGNGLVHRKLKEILDGNGGALLFASAGNTALRHWGGPAAPDRDGWHEWQPRRRDNSLRPNPGERVSVELAHGTDAVFDLVIVDSKTGEEVGRARSSGDGHRRAAVRFVPRDGQRYTVRLRVVEGRSPRFHLTVLGGKLGVATRQGSIAFPGDGPEVVAVCAVDDTGRRQNYSSCGPCSCASKPDLSARVPFPSVWRPGQPFSGTSAAAPQAAALAALVWADAPHLSAAQVRQVLATSAQRLRAGHCSETGHGVARLPKVESRRSPLDTKNRAR